MLFLTPMDRFCVGDSVWVECKIKFLSKGRELMVAHGEEINFMTRKGCCYKTSLSPAQTQPSPAPPDLSQMGTQLVTDSEGARIVTKRTQAPGCRPTPKPAKLDLSKMRELNWFETIEKGDWVRTSSCGRVKPVEYCFGMTVNYVFDYVKNNINANQVVTFYRPLK
jgi:hypothetical protein